MSVIEPRCPSFITCVSSLRRRVLSEFESVSSFESLSNFWTVPVSCLLEALLEPMSPVVDE